MAAKPTDTFRWATDASTTVEPAGARKDTGFRYGKKAPAKWFNWLFNGAYQWFEYLSDGALVGNHSIAGDLDVTQAATFGDSIGVDGAVTAAGYLYGTSGAVTPANRELSLNFDPFPGGDWTVVSGTGSSRGHGTCSVADGYGLMPIRLAQGMNVTQVSVVYDQSDANTTPFDFALERSDSDGTKTIMATATGSTSAQTNATLTDSSISSATIDNTTYSYHLWVKAADAGTTKIRKVKISYTDPGPNNG